MGLIYENENDSDGIKNVLENLHGKYIPYANDDIERVYGAKGIVGDQLSVERGVNCLLHCQSGMDPEERLEGLHFEIADFHGGMKFPQVQYPITVLINKNRFCNTKRQNFRFTLLLLLSAKYFIGVAPNLKLFILKTSNKGYRV